MNKFRYHISRTIAKCLPDKLYLSIKFRTRLGYWMDWSKPETFGEKLQWLKIYDRHPEYTQMVDKVTAKDYAADIIGKEYIIPTLDIYNSVDEIDFNKLPNQFVLKCTHDSGGQVICKDKNKLDVENVKKKLRKGLKRTYIIQNREYPYKNVPRRIIAEKYMQNGTDSELTDYKFFCFNGKARYCQVIADRHTDETIDFYDREWKHQPFIGLQPNAHHALTLHQAPDNYEIILNLVDKLAEKIASPFVRIDFYVINSHPYFGEITFFPASGIGVFKPQEWNLKLGEMIKLPQNIYE